MHNFLSNLLNEVASVLLEQKKVGPIKGVWKGTQLHINADRIIHKLIVEKLNAFDASIPIISEEDINQETVYYDKYWLIDPLDGTASYAENFDGYVSQIALIKDHIPVVAAVISPKTGEYFYAELGGVSFKNNNLLKCVANKTTTLIDNYSEPSGITKKMYTELNMDTYIESGSLGLKLCRIADGTADIFFKDVIVRDWDIAPGHLIVQEANGFVKNKSGKQIKYKGRGEINGIIATSNSQLLNNYLNLNI